MSICANEAYTAEATTDVLAILFSEFIVEFYLYPTVGTVLIHSVKPELTE